VPLVTIHEDSCVLRRPRLIASILPIPQRAPLPLHGDAGGIADLDPEAARAGSIGAIDGTSSSAASSLERSARRRRRQLWARNRNVLWVRA
jgi:hypothetical protein